MHSFELVKVLFKRVVVKIGALIRPAHHGANEVRIFPNLLVAHGGFEAFGMILNPFGKIDRGAVELGGWWAVVAHGGAL
jgi:hypothetical protein